MSSDLMEKLRAMPVSAWPCKNCRYLKQRSPETTGQCTFYEELFSSVAEPLSGSFGVRVSGGYVTKKFIHGPHTEEPMRDCPQFAAKEDK